MKQTVQGTQEAARVLCCGSVSLPCNTNRDTDAITTKLGANTTAAALRRLRLLKARVRQLRNEQVSPIRRVLMALLDEPEDMAMMYLTEARAIAQAAARAVQAATPEPQRQQQRGGAVNGVVQT